MWNLVETILNKKVDEWIVENEGGTQSGKGSY